MVSVALHVLGERRHRLPPLVAADGSVEVGKIGGARHPVGRVVLGEERDRHPGGEVSRDPLEVLLDAGEALGQYQHSHEEAAP